MENQVLKDKILEQNKSVQSELTGIAKGYEQALGWVISVLNTEEATQTVNSGPTVVANQEK